MSTTWQPPDISEVCANQIGPSTACSQIGFAYLALITQLFGNSIDNQFSYPRVNPYATQSLNSPSFGTQGLGIDNVPLGPAIGTTNVGSSITPGIGPAITKFNEPINEHKTSVHTFGPKGSRGFSETTLNIKQNPNFSFDKSFTNAFTNFESTPSVFDYNQIGRSRTFDTNTADSNTVTVTEKITEKNSRRKRQAVEEYDFIVVGAGSAGCVVASRLSEVKKWKVLLLEAGPEEPDVTSVPSFAPVLSGSSIDWSYRTQPEELTCRAQLGQTCRWISGRVMGGSSALNYLVYMRGNRRDYDGWADLGNYGWSYAEVLPYFKKSENNRDIEARDKYYHAVGGPLNIERFSYIDQNAVMLIEAFKETGLPLVDFNGKNQIGTMAAQTTSKNGRRVSANTAFIKPIRTGRSNLVVETNAEVTQILIDPQKKKAYGVKYIKDGVWCEVHAKKEVIISAGALNSPKLLMLSGIGPKEDLESLDIPVIMDLKVGHNLHDHVTTEAMLIGLTNKTSTFLSPDDLLREIKEFHQTKYRAGPLTSTGPVQITAFIRTKYAEEDETVPDVQFHFDGRNLREFYADPKVYLASRIFPFSFYDSINVRPILLLPKSRGCLKLNRTNPVFGQPLIYSRFFTVQRDADKLVAALEFITKLEKTKAFRENGVEFVKRPVDACTNYQWGTYDYFYCLITSYTGTIFHPTGTCKMGPHWDKDAVVDPRLSVYGVRNLRVADASVMPNIPRGNTNAAIIMIGEKVADMIKEDWDHYVW